MSFLALGGKDCLLYCRRALLSFHFRMLSPCRIFRNNLFSTKPSFVYSEAVISVRCTVTVWRIVPAFIMLSVDVTKIH